MNIKEVLENAIQDITEARNKLSGLLGHIAVMKEDSKFGGEIESALFYVLEDLKKAKETV